MILIIALKQDIIEYIMHQIQKIHLGLSGVD